jgi:hypothetical protein
VLLETESEHLFAYAKRSGDNVVVVVVNTDPLETREGVAVLPPRSAAAAFASRQLGGERSRGTTGATTSARTGQATSR